MCLQLSGSFFKKPPPAVELLVCANVQYVNSHMAAFYSSFYSQGPMAVITPLTMDLGTCDRAPHYC